MINAFNYTISPVSSVGFINSYYNNQSNNNKLNQGSQDFSQKNEQDDFKKVLKDTVSISIDADKRKEDYMACNHNPNDDSTSLEKLNKRVMVTPTAFWFKCRECNRGFKFIKNSNGKLEEAEQ